MQAVLLVVQFILAVALVVVILLQRTAQDGGGLVGGGNTMGGLFTARGTANILTRFTKWLAIAFIANSLGLGFIAGHQHENHSLINHITPASTHGSASSAPSVNSLASPPASSIPPSSEKAPDISKPHAEPEVPMAH